MPVSCCLGEGKEGGKEGGKEEAEMLVKVEERGNKKRPSIWRGRERMR